jgi:hypothetical protein
MSIILKVVTIFGAVLLAGMVEARVPAPFALTNVNIQSISVNASFFNFMSVTFNGN